MTETRLEVQQTQKLSQGLQTIIHLLSLDLNELSEYMFKAVQENPALEYVPPRKSPQDYAMQVRTRYSGSRRSGEETDLELAASPETDIEDLEQQLRLSRLDADTVHLARHILHLLSSRGYFTEDLDAFAVENGVSPEMARRALEAVQ